MSSFLEREGGIVNFGSDGEQSSQLIEMIKKFPTAAFVAGQLHGWDSDHERSLLNHFKEDLIAECGDELSLVLEHFRLASFNPPHEASEIPRRYCEMCRHLRQKFTGPNWDHIACADALGWHRALLLTHAAA
jgi:hypothetical protein